MDSSAFLHLCWTKYIYKIKVPFSFSKITFCPKLLKWNPIWTNWNEILGFSSHAFELKTHSNPKWSSCLVLYIPETEYSLFFSAGFGDIFPCSVWFGAIICLSFSWLYLTIWRSTIWLFDVWKYNRIYIRFDENIIEYISEATMLVVVLKDIEQSGLCAQSIIN